MEKFYVKPTSKVVELESEVLLAGSNRLDNDENGDAGAKGFNPSDEWDD